MKIEIPPWAAVVVVLVILAVVGVLYWKKGNEGTVGSVDVGKLVGPPPSGNAYQAGGTPPPGPSPGRL
ncbi:MAG: hypothetical protein IT208_03630 [Chthonomonadales bacterium]|nr:hypothetical protein [Chthonomonadales bacterium]